MSGKADGQWRRHWQYLYAEAIRKTSGASTLGSMTFIWVAVYWWIWAASHWWFRWMWNALSPACCEYVHRYCTSTYQGWRQFSGDHWGFAKGVTAPARKTVGRSMAVLDDKSEVHGTGGVVYADLYMGNAGRFRTASPGYGYAMEKVIRHAGGFTVFEEVFTMVTPHELKHL